MASDIIYILCSNARSYDAKWISATLLGYKLMSLDFEQQIL